MSEPFIGQITMFGGNFAPINYAFCSGQLLAISQNDALFALIGTTYGGDGQTTFALPNMQGRIPIHQGNLAGGSSYVLGQTAGNETVTVINSQMPSHSHSFASSSASGTALTPANAVPASTSLSPYVQGAADTPMGNQAIGAAGGNQPHDNMMPFTCVNFIIALFGVFPARN